MKRDAASHKLLTPISIGSMVLKNRIVMPAMGTNYGSSSGEVTQRNIDYYAERAEKGGMGLIIVEVTSIDQAGKFLKHQLGNHDDHFKPGLEKLASAIKQHGVKACVQVHHGGRFCRSKITGLPIVAPSSIAGWNRELPHELSEAEIGELVRKYAEAAKRAKVCGFDAVELHFTHGYLGAQFLSPLTNKRRDKYGGDLENRARFCLETIAATRELVGKDYPVLVRLTGYEYIRGGLTILDSQTIAQLFEAAGVDAIDVSVGYRPSSEEGYIASSGRSISPMYAPRGCFVHVAEGVKKKVKIPVIAVGRINDLSLAEEVVASGKADLVACGRAFLADPEFGSKWVEGRGEDIRRCIACNACETCLVKDEPIRCAVNAALGREREYKITPSPRRKKVLVIGGGPGGMEAARVAATRGHDVVLTEKRDKLGGNLLSAMKANFKSEIGLLLQYQSNQIRRQGIKAQLNTSVDKEYVRQLKPNVVVLASGAQPVIPKVKGVEKTIVTDAVKVLMDEVDAGFHAVVVGGGRVGCEVCVYLAQQGKKVTLLSRRNTDFGIGAAEGLAPDEEGMMRKWLLFDLWPDLGITVLGNITIKEITDEGILVAKKDSGDRFIRCDKVVFAMGMTSIGNDLSEEIKKDVAEFYRIGDSVEPRTIMEAIHEAAEVALKI